MGFPGGSDGKEYTCNVEDLGSIPGLGRSPGEGKGYPLQYSGLENSMVCIVPGVAKNQTLLSNIHFQAEEPTQILGGSIREFKALFNLLHSMFNLPLAVISLHPFFFTCCFFGLESFLHLVLFFLQDCA